MTIFKPFDIVCLTNRNLVVECTEKGLSIDSRGSRKERCKDCESFHSGGIGV